MAHIPLRLGDMALGLHCGLHASESSFGLVAPLISHAPTLRRALELMAQFQPMLADAVQIRLTERTGVAQLRVDSASDNGVDRSFVELVVAGLMRTLQGFGATRDDIHAVCFEHARPVHALAYREAFSCAEQFAQSYSGIEFAALALDRRHLKSQAELHTLLLAHAERSLERLSRPLTCTERVRALMHSRTVSQLPDMIAAARALGLSVRSLRRHLGEEGTSYRELAQSMCHETACSMLRDPALTVQSIAHALGF
ncbi:MAG: hypothetical protein RL701_215 [Pseudomonadota bacterium]